MALKQFENISKNMSDVAYGYLLKHIFSPLEIEGIIKGDVLEDELEHMFKGRSITKAHPPLGIVATDINKAKQVIFTNVREDIFKSNEVNDSRAICVHSPDVKLSEIVRASCSMPIAFIPKEINGMKLVDGGLTNNLPSDIALALGADKVISIDLGSAHEVNTDGIIDIGLESINIFMMRIVDDNRENFGLYLNPEIFDISALQFDRIQECFDRGYKYGLSQIDNIVKYLEEEAK
jgi:NTE family protein